MNVINFMKVKWNLNSCGIAQNMLEQHVPSRKIFDVHVHEIVSKKRYSNNSFIIGGKTYFDLFLNCLSCLFPMLESIHGLIKLYPKKCVCL